MTKPMVTPEFAAALKRVEEIRAKARERALAPPPAAPPPRRRLLRRSVLATNGLEDTSGHAISLLGRSHILGQKK